MIWEWLSFWKMLWLSLILVAWSILLTVHLQNAQANALRPYPTLLTTNTELITNIQYWEALREKSPTHREILENLALLYQAQGNASKAAELHNQANIVDPNWKKPQ